MKRAALALAIAAIALGGESQASGPDPFAAYVAHQQTMLQRHPGHVVIEAYRGAKPVGSVLVPISGMQTRVVGKRPWRPCWYTAWTQGEGLQTRSCRGNQ